MVLTQPAIRIAQAIRRMTEDQDLTKRLLVAARVRFPESVSLAEFEAAVEKAKESSQRAVRAQSR